MVEIFSRTAHTHREFELCLLLRGGMQIDMAEGRAKLHPGEMALISPWQPHAFQAEAEGALLLILQASPQFCAGYFPQAAQLRFEGRFRCRRPAQHSCGRSCWSWDVTAFPTRRDMNSLPWGW